MHNDKRVFYKKFPFEFLDTKDDTVRYRCSVKPSDAGVIDFSIRIIPANPMLPHDMDFNLVKWL
jgi:hypothetical protein